MRSIFSATARTAALLALLLCLGAPSWAMQALEPDGTPTPVQKRTTTNSQGQNGQQGGKQYQEQKNGNGHLIIRTAPEGRSTKDDTGSKAKTAD
jgi:hypothetical protein